MKSKLITLSLLAAALITAPALQAQAPAGLRPVWDVPFDFVVGDQTLPAGQYTVRQDAPRGTVLIRSLDWKVGQFRIANKVHAGRVPDRSQLVFRRYGSKNFLARIWVAGSEYGSELPKSAFESEISRRGPTEAVAMVAR